MPGSTENRRPDLEMLEVNPGFPYLASNIFPVLNRDGKAGTLYYRTVPSDQSAQTGRTPGAVPTTNTQSASSTTFATAERIHRENLPDDDDALKGGVEAAYEDLTVVCKRSIMRATEALVVAATINNEANITKADILTSFRKAMDTAFDAIHRYPGRTVMACSWTAYRRLSRFSEFTDTLLRTGVPSEMEASAILQNAPVKLAEIIGVSQILVGDDDHWPADRALVFKQAPGADGNGRVVDPRQQAQLGRLVQYMPGNESEFQIDAWYEPTTRAYTVDGVVWNVAKLLNSGAAYILDGIDEGNATVTTTTTA